MKSFVTKQTKINILLDTIHIKNVQLKMKLYKTYVKFYKTNENYPIKCVENYTEQLVLIQYKWKKYTFQIEIIENKYKLSNKNKTLPV